MNRFVWLTLLASALCLGGCVNSQRYAGIPFATGAADPALQELAQQAMAGDKHAQFQLAIYYQYASYGRGIDVRSLLGDHAQSADVKFVSEILELELPSKEVKKVGSPWLVYMTRARALLEKSATDSGGKKTQMIPASYSGGAVSMSRFSTGRFQKGLADAAALLVNVNNSIFRHKFVTNFDSPYSYSCESDYYKDSDWQREAHFIVEGYLTSRFIESSHDAKNAGETDLGVRHHLDGPQYEVEIEIVKFLKWPDEFPKPKKLSILDQVTHGAPPPLHGEGSYGCTTWGPDRASTRSYGVVILQYSNDPFGSGKFHIIKTTLLGSTD